MPDEWRTEKGLKLLHACIRKLQAEEELRQRAIGQELTPEHAFNLVYETTDNVEKAQEAKEELERQRLKYEHGERQ